ncbi:MAG: DoxX family membrane protein [Elusimicrobiaceae bacterium]|nr:DoxX family membrane protein [Elusimicrobiaceae bacterium]
MPEPVLTMHCNINETAFSWAMFLCRLFTGLALVYMALGSLLYWREFLVNTAALGLPYTVGICFGLCGAELLIGLFLLLGWYTRFWAALALAVGCVCGFVFFLGEFNKVWVAFCLLLAAANSVLICLGPGAISLDYKRSQRAAQKIWRGSL